MVLIILLGLGTVLAVQDHHQSKAASTSRKLLEVVEVLDVDLAQKDDEPVAVAVDITVVDDDAGDADDDAGEWDEPGMPDEIDDDESPSMAMPIGGGNWTNPHMTPMAGPALASVANVSNTVANATDMVDMLTNMPSIMNNTDATNVTGERLGDMTEDMFNIAEAFEMELMETEAYKQAYELHKTPLNISDMAEGLRELVDACSANVTGGEFCNTCVRPIARLEIRSYYKHMREDNIPEDLSEPAMHAVYDRAGEQLMSFLAEEGVPMDDYFYANVIFCTLHKSDPMCKIPTEELEQEMTPILEECGKVEEALVKRSEPMGMYTLSQNVTHAKGIEQYCSKCYWPFVSYMVSNSLTDEFWCTNRHLLNEKKGNETLSNETSLVDLLHTDTSFISCMENARGMFFEKGVDPFDPELTNDVRDFCWDDEYFPENKVITSEARAYIDVLEC